MRTGAAPARAHRHHFGHGIPPKLALVDGRQPSWLLSPYSTLTWQVRETKERAPLAIRFDCLLPTGEQLSVYGNLIDTVKRVTYAVREGPRATVETAQVQRSIAWKLLYLARWMVSRSILRFDDLTSEDIQEFAESCAFGVHSLLNTESALVVHLKRVYEELGPEWKKLPVDERRARAMKLVPTETYNPFQVNLHRGELCRQAGAGNTTLADSGLSIILDRFCREAGFHLQPSQSRRLSADVGELEDDEPVTLTAPAIREYLNSLKLLYLHRATLEDAIHFDPFPGRTMRDLAQALGADAGRTPTIPIRQATHFYERAARWVLNYSQPLLEVKEWADAHADLPANEFGRALGVRVLEAGGGETGPCSPFPLSGVGWSRKMADASPQSDSPGSDVLSDGKMAFNNALSFLLTACVVIIAAFTARRAAEIKALKAGCIEYDKATNQPWIRVFIYKTLNEERLIPVPSVVVEAVKVLERMGERARVLTGTEFLLQYDIPGTETVVGVDINGYRNIELGHRLATFGFWLDVPPLKDGTRWTFRPHQFRRFFAIMYVWVYQDGELAALSHFLGHWNPDMTRRYVTEGEVGRIIAQEAKERTATILTEATLGRMKVSGAPRLMAAAKRMYARLASTVEVVSERRLHARMARLAQRAGVSFRAFSWGACARSNGAQAPNSRCADKESGLVNHSAASANTCTGCDFDVTMLRHLPLLESRIGWHSKVADNENLPPIRRAASRVLVETMMKTAKELKSDEGSV